MSEMKSTKAPTIMALHSDSHKQTILSKFETLRKKDLLCDITVIVEDVHFKAHKALLAASSEYFSALLTVAEQAPQSVYRLDGIMATVFAAVLEFIYSARVSVEESITEELLATARLMEVGELIKALTEITNSEAGVKPLRTDSLKNKRGRPKKSVCAAPDSTQKQKAEGLEGVMSKGNPETAQSRQSKRRIRTPVKFKGYKMVCEEIKEPGRRGCKRKHPNTEARCEDCGKVFKHHLFLQIHQRTHTGEKPFHCPVCGKSFTQKHTLTSHQRIHTGEKPFVCTVCSKALSTKHSLQDHMNLHEEKSFECEKCGKIFTQRKQLKSHFRVHSGKSQPECAQCHHKFMDVAQLKKHLRTHTGEKPFTCEICGKCFTAKSTLQTHIRIHRGEKPYKCNICEKSFSDPSARRRHVTSHSGKKPFTCSICSLSFTRLDNLKTHTKSHNKESAASADVASAATPQEEECGVSQLQPFQAPLGATQLQLVVTNVVENINFVSTQDQEINLLTADREKPQSAQSRLALFTQPSGQVQNLTLVTQDDTAAASSSVHAIRMLESQQPEQMHVITLSKEAIEQLDTQAPPHPLQKGRPPQLQLMQEALPHSQAIHVNSHGVQPISISHTTEQLSSHHIQGQTFQIQAGTVSYLYTTGLPPES